MDSETERITTSALAGSGVRVEGNSAVIRTEIAVYRRGGVEPAILLRIAGSWPGYILTGEPLRLPAGHFGLGHGSGAHLNTTSSSRRTQRSRAWTARCAPSSSTCTNLLSWAEGQLAKLTHYPARRTLAFARRSLVYFLS